MLDEKEEKFLELFKSQKGFINKNIKLKKNKEKGFHFIAKKNILKDTLLIKVPKKLLIPVEELNKKNKLNNEFNKIYYEILLDNSNYLNFHPLNSNEIEFNQIKSTIKSNKNLFKNFENKYYALKLLEPDKKNIELLSLTRAIFLKNYNKKFFMPLMDFVNYDENGTNYIQNKDSDVLINSNKNIKKDDEIYINYAHTDPITFYLKHGFITKNFNSFKIKKNELNLNFNSDLKLNSNYFDTIGNVIKFKEDIYFMKNKISKNIEKFMEIFPSSQKIKNMEKILNYYKGLIIINNEKVKELENSIILREFYKSAIIYKKVIDNYLKILQK